MVQPKTIALSNIIREHNQISFLYRQTSEAYIISKSGHSNNRKNTNVHTLRMVSYLKHMHT